MGDDRISRQISNFLDYMRDLLGESQSDSLLLCRILSSYTEPITPARGNNILIGKPFSNYTLFYCAFHNMGDGKGFYVATILRRLSRDDINDMRRYCKAIQSAFNYRIDVDLIEPINTVISFHILLNKFIADLPEVDGRICAPAPAKTKKKTGEKP